MRLPGYEAECSLNPARPYAGNATVRPAIDAVLLQDCPWYKRAGCVIGPLSWCAPASLGGAVPFWNCVDKLSGGNCLDCIGTADPRDTGGETGGGIVCDISGNCRPGTVGSTDQGLTSDAVAGLSAQIGALQRQLNQIERCACKFVFTSPASVSTFLPHGAFGGSSFASPSWMIG
jgi:hypothetical protein